MDKCLNKYLPGNRWRDQGWQQWHFYNCLPFSGRLLPSPLQAEQTLIKRETPPPWVPQDLCKGNGTLWWELWLAWSRQQQCGYETATSLEPGLAPWSVVCPEETHSKPQAPNSCQAVTSQPSPRAAVTADRTSAPSTLLMREKVQYPKSLRKKKKPYICQKCDFLMANCRSFPIWIKAVDILCSLASPWGALPSSQYWSCHPDPWNSGK